MDKIAFVYHGSSGISGGYSAKFIETASKNKSVHAFVNFHYDYNIAHKNVRIFRCFFPLTDRYILRDSFFRKTLRLMELISGYIFVLSLNFIFKYKRIFYSPITNLWFSLLFVRILKFVSKDIIIIVHDAASHYLKLEKYRDNIFKLAHRLVFHNENSRDILYGRLNSLTENHIILPFPWMRWPFSNQIQHLHLNDFIFIGHVRPSKGFEFLLNGFILYTQNGGSSSLNIAGKMTTSQFRSATSIKGISVYDEKLSDVNFIRELGNSKFVVMPYDFSYSNSSIHFSSILNCETPFICSDIPLFENFVDKRDCLKFTHGDLNSFVQTLFYAEKLSLEERNEMSKNALIVFNNSMIKFDYIMKQIILGE